MVTAVAYCPTCNPRTQLGPDPRGLRCPRCQVLYAAPAKAPIDDIASIGSESESDASMDDTIDSGSLPDGSLPSEIAQPLSEEMKAPFSEQFLQHYELKSFLGKGAMGAVYLMRQIKLDRLVAVKVVNIESISEDVSRRLVQEAKVLASLNHVNILAIYDVGEDGALPYMVSEYVEGEPLSDRMRREPGLTLPQILKIIIQILDGLRAAHKQAIIHRDLKPSNVFLANTGRPKIGDFGLAKSQNAPSGTAVGRILGTPGYMSPEQCRGRAVTAASDIYAVGVMLFEMVAGRRPFTGPALLDYLRQHTMEPPPHLRSLVPDVPAALDAAVMRAMQKDPADRFKSAKDFRAALQDIQKQISPKDKGTTTGQSSSSTSFKASDLFPGTKLADRYELVKILGHGGMGQVWLAKDEIRRGVSVAIKLLPPELWRDPEARGNLVAEANIALQLSHPDIVRLINIEPGECPFLVMELITGPTLQEELSRRKKLGYGPMRPAETLVVMECISRALDYAHDQNVIHRDIKPANLILTLEADTIIGAKLADFGIAAELANFKTRATGTAPAGTLSYMSPEQVACQKLDRRADVYSLGASLFQMLTGAPPYKGDDIAMMIRNDPIPDLEGVPLAVATVVKASLAKDPNARPGTAGDLYHMLREAVAATDGGAFITNKSVAAKGGENPENSLSPDSQPSSGSSDGSMSSTPMSANPTLSTTPPTNQGAPKGMWVPTRPLPPEEDEIRIMYESTINVTADQVAAMSGGGKRRSHAGLVIGGAVALALTGALTFPLWKVYVMPPTPSATSSPPPPTQTASVVAPTPAVPPGKLSIEPSEKGVRVRIDDALKKVSPALVTLAAGEHTVSLDEGDYEDVTTTITINSNAIETWKPELKRRSVPVRVSSNVSGAEVLVGNESKGSVDEVTVPAGLQASITVRAKGYKPQSKNLLVHAREDERDLRFVLDAEPVKVVITSVPDKAEVWNDYGKQGVTPFETTAPINTVVTFKLKLKDYKDTSIEGKSKPGEVLELKGTLEALPKPVETPSAPPSPASTLTDEQIKMRDMRLETARSLFLKQDYEKAEAAIQDVLAVDKNNVESLKMLARVYLGTQNAEMAEGHMKTAFNLAPSDPEVLDLYATVLMVQNKFEAAETIARTLNAEHKDNASYMATLVQVLCATGDAAKKKEGREVADKALKLKSDLGTKKALKELISSCK